MFTMEDLEVHYGKTIEINDMTFTLEKHEDLSGVSAVWKNDSYLIYATPMFDNVPVPIQIIDVNGQEFGEDSYHAEVEDFAGYIKIVKTLASKILRRPHM
jgi:hypothetical protein